VTTIPAGTKISAALLGNALPLSAVVTSDTTVTSSTSFVDAAGMVLALAASSTYLIDGYLAYSAGATGDIQVAWSSPDGWSGSWSWQGLGSAAVGGAGDMNGVRIGPNIEAFSVVLGGSDSFSGALAARLGMYIATDATAGSLQLRFAQNVSNGTASVVRQGSWLRAQKAS
jgi:hypothetical protein